MDTENRLLISFIQRHTDESADLIEGFDRDSINQLLGTLPLNLAAKLILRMDREYAISCLEKMDKENAFRMFDTFPLVYGEMLLRKLDEAKREIILGGMSAEKSETLRMLLSYSTEMVGAYMETRIFSQNENQTVRATIENLRDFPGGTLSHIFVTNRNQELVGIADIRELFTTDSEKRLKTIMDTAAEKVIAELNINALLKADAWPENYFMLPVTDSRGILVGGVTRDVFSRATGKKSDTYDRKAVQASAALGDLYQIGLSSFFKSASEIL